MEVIPTGLPINIKVNTTGEFKVEFRAKGKTEGFASRYKSIYFNGYDVLKKYVLHGLQRMQGLGVVFRDSELGMSAAEAMWRKRVFGIHGK